MLRERANDRALAGGVGGGDVLAPTLLSAGEHRVFVARARLEYAEQVLEARLLGSDRFGSANRVWHVALERYTEPSSLFSNREVCLAWNPGLRLDEGHAAFLQHAYGGASVLRAADSQCGRVIAFWTVQHRAGYHHPRTQQLTGRDAVARTDHRIEVAPHVTNAGDAVRDEEGQHQLAAVPKAEGVGAEKRVRMHVPQPRDQVKPSGIHRHTGRAVLRASQADIRDAVAFDDYGGVLQQSSIGHTHDTRVPDGDRL